MKKYLKITAVKLFIILLVIGLDLLTKHFFYKTDYTIIPKLLGFRVVSGLNTGGAWSIFSSSTTMLIVFTIIIVLGIIAFDVYFRKTNIVYSFAISFLLGGAIGNLIDRVALGGVRDFIFFPFMPNFPTFNIADTFIFFGAVLLFIYVLFLFKPQNKTEQKEVPSATTKTSKINVDEGKTTETENASQKQKRITKQMKQPTENDASIELTAKHKTLTKESSISTKQKK